MNIKVSPDSKTAVYIQIARQLRSMIIGGELLAGFPLPSERELARELGIHRNTVIKAYSELKADGIITSKQGKGYAVSYGCEDEIYPTGDAGCGDGKAAGSRSGNCAVCGNGAVQGAPAVSAVGVGIDRAKKAVNWAELIKDEYLDMGKSFDLIFQRAHSEKKISFAAGVASPSIYKEKDVAGQLAEILSSENESAGFYSPYQGDTALRHRLSAWLRTKGIEARDGQIQIMSETNQALDYLFTLFLRPGDAVIIEEPISPDVYKPIKLAGAEAITVPVDKDGMMCDRLEPLIIKRKPRFIYVNSSYHDPTGAELSLERRKKLLELSYKYRIPIIEDDAASEIGFEGAALPSIKSLDKGGANVIYIYSFALTFVPGIGMAFVAGPEQVVKSMSYLVSMRLINLDWISQKLLARYLEKGIYQRRIEEFRAEYKAKRDAMCEWLERCRPLSLSYEKPRGGVYVWCRLPDGISDSQFASRAAKAGLRVTPGRMFYADGKGGRDHIRLNYSFVDRKQIDAGMRIFCEVLEELVR